METPANFRREKLARQQNIPRSPGYFQDRTCGRSVIRITPQLLFNHVGGVLGVGPYSGRRQEILVGWRKDITEMAKCPNVYCKLGGIGMVRSAIHRALH
jgi:hypothetical protein